jgi:hypothetical protein
MLPTLASAYSYSYNSSGSSHGGGALVPLFIVGGIFVILEIIGMWKVFVKAGKPGWTAIIPIYDTYMLYEISGKPGWWVVFSLIPFVGPFVTLVLMVLAMQELAKRFGKSPVFGVIGLVLFAFVGFLILGFGDATYHVDGEVGESRFPFQPSINPTAVTPHNPVTQAPAENVTGEKPKDTQPPSSPIS